MIFLGESEGRFHLNIPSNPADNWGEMISVFTSAFCFWYAEPKTVYLAFAACSPWASVGYVRRHTEYFCRSYSNKLRMSSLNPLAYCGRHHMLGGAGVRPKKTVKSFNMWHFNSSTATVSEFIITEESLSLKMMLYLLQNTSKGASYMI